MLLSEKQRIFTSLVGRFLDDLAMHGFSATFGEAYRPPEMAEIYVKEGKGIKNSLHTQRLAIDLNIFSNGILITEKENLLLFGELWESYSSVDIKCCWGGHFSNPDCDHFSIEHGAIR